MPCSCPVLPFEPTLHHLHQVALGGGPGLSSGNSGTVGRTCSADSDAGASAICRVTVGLVLIRLVPISLKIGHICGRGQADGGFHNGLAYRAGGGGEPLRAPKKCSGPNAIFETERGVSGKLAPSSPEPPPAATLTSISHAPFVGRFVRRFV